MSIRAAPRRVLALVVCDEIYSRRFAGCFIIKFMRNFFPRERDGKKEEEASPPVLIWSNEEASAGCSLTWLACKLLIAFLLLHPELPLWCNFNRSL
jgi:hypothetical protein